MANQLEIIELVRQAAKQKILFLPHALRQMSRTERMISTSEVRRVIEKGEVIEDYPEDARGHSCLMLGFAEGLGSGLVSCNFEKKLIKLKHGKTTKDRI